MTEFTEEIRLNLDKVFDEEFNKICPIKLQNVLDDRAYGSYKKAFNNVYIKVFDKVTEKVAPLEPYKSYMDRLKAEIMQSVCKDLGIKGDQQKTGMFILISSVLVKILVKVIEISKS